MSERSESADDSAVLSMDGSLVEVLKEKYHVFALFGVMAFMLYVRLGPYDRFTQNGEVLFSGNDAWYHLREVSYTVRNWPSTMPFDPWTYFPFGTSQGQFGTLYDQLVATAALLIGLGSPSQELVAKTLLVAPAVFGALTAIPVYYIGKRLGGRLAGLFGAVVLMLLPGTFLQRTMVGVADHNGVEPLFQALAVLALLVAFAVAEREKPIWELVVDRDTDALRTPLAWAALAGVATALYMWVWPPGVLLVGVVGGFVVLKQVSDTVNGGSPEPIAFAATVSMAVTTLLMAVQIEVFRFTATRFSLLQPSVAFAIAVGSVFLAWLARQWEARDVDLSLYPVAVFGLIAVGLGAIALVLPDVFGTLRANLLRTVGFNAGAQTRTIAEARPFLDPTLLQQRGVSQTGQILSEYGLAMFTAVIAAGWLLVEPLLEDGDTREYGYVGGAMAVIGLMFLAPSILNGLAAPLDSALSIPVTGQLLGLVVIVALIVGATLLTRYDAEQLFVIVWAAFITSAAFTQIRFNYYLAVVVAVLNAYLFYRVMSLPFVGLLSADSVSEAVEDIQFYQVAAIAVVLLVVLGPALTFSVGVGAQGSQQSSANSLQVADSHGPGAVTQWSDSFAWMQNNTPTEGNYGGAGNAEQLDYYGTYSEGEGNYDYPEGAYGVMSWWDYGHWITVQGERIPTANPFQQGATTAANYLLAPSEAEANSVLENMDSKQADEGNQTRYVMVDYQMATPGQKFGAPIVFYDESDVASDDFYFPLYQEVGEGQFRQLTLVNQQRYYDSMMVRLYETHGSALEPQPVAIDYEVRTLTNPNTGEEITIRTTPSGNQSALRQFQNMSAARAFVEEDGSAQIGGLPGLPSERVPALEHYRLVKASESDAPLQGGPAWVKTFERVDGATVEGSGPANATVTARVQMRIPSQERNFTYTQQVQTDENGQFTMTLPYSTAGYDEFGPENGHTNVSVRATGQYQFISGPTTDESGTPVIYSASADVTEAQVIGEDTTATQVELQSEPLFEQSNDSSSGNESTGNETTTDGTSGNTTNETSQSLTSPSTTLVEPTLAPTAN